MNVFRYPWSFLGTKVRDSPKEGVCKTGPPEVQTDFSLVFKESSAALVCEWAAALEQLALLRSAAAPRLTAPLVSRTFCLNLSRWACCPPTSCPALFPLPGVISTSSLGPRQTLEVFPMFSPEGSPLGMALARPRWAWSSAWITVLTSEQCAPLMFVLKGASASLHVF